MDLEREFKKCKDLSPREIWDACTRACAKICEEHAVFYEIESEIQIYQARQCSKVCRELKKEMNNGL